MEERGGADQVGTRLEGDAARRLGIFEFVDRGEMAIGQCCVRQRPEVLGWLQLRRIGGQEEQMHVLGHTQPHTRVPARPVQHEHDLLGRAGAHRLGERRQLRLKERDVDGRGQVEDGPSGGRMDEANEVAPLEPMLDRREGALPVEAPDLVEDRLQPDAVLVNGPEFDLRLREGRGDGAEERPEVFLKAFCSAGSACTCRGRGLRRLPSSRTR